MSAHELYKNDQKVDYQLEFTDPLSLLSHWAEVDSSKQAVVFDAGKDQSTQIWTYAELTDQVQALAHWLRSVQQDKDQHSQRTTKNRLPPSLGFAFENSPEVILLNYAAWSAGWCSVPLDTTRDTTERKIYKLQQAKCRLLVCRKGLLADPEKQAIQLALPDLRVIEVENYQELVSMTVANQAQFSHKQTAQTTNNSDLSTHPALILYTSGTTALPKGAVLSLTNLFANAQSVAEWLKITEQDRWAVILPLHHINSTTFVNSVLLVGGTVVLIPHYSKSHFWNQLATHQVTGTSVVPTVAFDQLSEAESFDQHKNQLKQLTRIQIGSAPVQPSNVKQFVDRFGIKLVQGYGQTETSLRSTGVPYPSDEQQYQWAIKSNTLGTELTYTNVTILDEQGKELPADEVGEICVRGPIIMQRYLDNEEETAKAFAFDWFHSGDTGYWEEHEGLKYFFLQGRSKEIIKKGGVLISPLAIENALLAHYPDLQQAYIIGFPDQRLGEQIGLIAIGKAGIGQQILQDAKSGKVTGLQPYEYPVATMELTDTDLPKTSTGKIQRVELRRLYAELLLEQYRTVSRVDDLVFRKIGAEESDLLTQAVEIDRSRWGETLAGTKHQFEQRAEHGTLIGCIDEKGELLGTISAGQIRQTDLDQTGEPGFWTSTWDGVTGNGTLQTNNHKGECLLLVAVASLGKNQSGTSHPGQPSRHPELVSGSSNSGDTYSSLTFKQIEKYCQSGQDPVLSFHYTAKGGLSKGAHFVKALPKARHADTESLGYCVLVEYPTLDQTPTINPHASIGTQLVEAALLFAYQQRIKHVFAYSRPVGLLNYLKHQPPTAALD